MVRREVVCRCGVYDFPHRFSGGKCNGYSLVVHCFENHLMCTHCTCRSENQCDVINETEHPRECPYVQEFCEINEIKLP